jgi:hypothetical protein
MPMVVELMDELSGAQMFTKLDLQLMTLSNVPLHWDSKCRVL